MLLSSLDPFSRTLLDLTLAGTLLLRPLYAEEQQAIVDFAYAYVNPAAQYMLRLPAEPTLTMLQNRPHLDAAGVFAFYCEAYQSGRASYYGIDFAHDGLDSYYQLAAQRQGELLLVSFTDTADRNRGSVEMALRESQTRERAARAEAEQQRQALQRAFEQAPVAIAVYRGPQYIIELANPTVCRLWGRTAGQILGLGLFEALPEVAGMGYEELLDGVMATGEPYVAHAMPAVHEREGRRDTVYWDFVYVPMYETDGRIYGVMVVATEVTEQVLTRQRAEQLAQELEARVAERTGQLAGQQRLLGQILRQVPAAIAALSGPEHRFTFFNEPYQQLAAGRTQSGLTVAEVFPEVVEQGFVNLLDEVYATGQPFIGTDMPAQLHDAATGQPELRYVDFTYQPLTDEQGRPEGVLAFIVDVTERVRARQQAETLQAAMLGVAQRRAQEREDLFQVFEQTPAAILLLRGPEHRVEYFNPTYAQLLQGRVRRGLALAEMQPEAVKQGFGQLLDQVYRTGEAYYGNEQPVELRQPDGQAAMRYFNFTYNVYREEGQTAGISVFALDVTEQVLARRQREAQQAELQRMFEQAPVAIAILRGPQLVVELANDSAAAIWGRSVAQLRGRPYFEALPDMVDQGFEQILHGVLATGAPVELREAPVQIALNAAAPVQRYFNLSFGPLYDEQHRPTAVIVIGIDVTGQVRARQQVEMQRQFLQQLVNGVPAAVATFNGPGHLLSAVNDMYRQIIDRPVTPGQLAAELLPEMVNQGFIDLLSEVYATGQPVQQREVFAFLVHPQTRQRTQHYLNVNYQPILGPDGQPTGVLSAAVDVTEQVLARQQVQTLNEELAAINEELRVTNEELHQSNTRLMHTNVDLDNFIYTASHDLKAPIANIEGLVYALRQDLPAELLGTEHIAHLLELIDHSVQRFQQTLGHLTNLTRLQQVGAGPAEDVDLAALVEDVRLDLAPTLAATGGHLTVAVAECPTMRFAPKNLRSIVFNLLSNALKYHDASRPAQVTLRATCLEQWVEIVVQDNGLGLSATQQTKLFGLFRRLHTHVEGSGVGLYVVKKIVENAGGTIQVASESGVGSTFTVRLPRQGH